VIPSIHNFSANNLSKEYMSQTDSPKLSDNTDGYQTFRLVAHMQTPVILQGDLTLESLLAACVFQSTGLMREEALAQVPIGKIPTDFGDVWQASAVMLAGRVKQVEHTFVRGRHFTEVGPDFYAGNPRARKDAYAIAQDNGDYKRLLNTYAALEVSSLVWYAHGDMKACRQLLATQTWLGKRRGSGFGQVAQVSVEPWGGNPLVDDTGLPRRPIPLRKLPFIEGLAARDRQRVLSCVDQHPSWAHPAELCAVPVSRIEPAPKAAVVDGEMFYF
jgi:CRISPR type IV-associated protein Csf3